MQLLLLLNVLFCTGLYVCGLQGKIFYGIASYLARKINIYSNPIINCLTCMSSLWGTIFYFGYYFLFIYPEAGLGYHHFIVLSLYIFSLAAINFVVDLILSLLMAHIQLIKRKTELISLDIQIKKANGTGNS